MLVKDISEHYYFTIIINGTVVFLKTGFYIFIFGLQLHGFVC